MEYINAADEDDVFADLESHLPSLQFLLEQFFEEKKARNVKWQYQRIKWEAHVVQLEHVQVFKQTYRMSLQAFQKLTKLLGKDINVDDNYCPDA